MAIFYYCNLYEKMISWITKHIRYDHACDCFKLHALGTLKYLQPQLSFIRMIN